MSQKDQNKNKRRKQSNSRLRHNNINTQSQLDIVTQSTQFKQKQSKFRYRADHQSNKNQSEQTKEIQLKVKQQNQNQSFNRSIIVDMKSNNNRTNIRLSYQKNSKNISKQSAKIVQSDHHKNQLNRSLQQLNKSNKKIQVTQNNRQSERRCQTQQQNSNAQICRIQQKFPLSNKGIGSKIILNPKHKKKPSSHLNMSLENIINKVKPHFTASMKNKQTNSLFSMKQFLNQSKAVPKNRYETDTSCINKDEYKKHPMRYYSVHKQQKKHLLQNSTPQPLRRLVIQPKVIRQKASFIQHENAVSSKMRLHSDIQVSINKIVDPNQGVMSKIRKNIQMKKMGRKMDDLKTSKTKIERQLNRVKQQINQCLEIKIPISLSFKLKQFDELVNHFIKFYQIVEFLKTRIEEQTTSSKKKNGNKMNSEQSAKPKKEKFMLLIDYVREYILQENDVSCIQQMLDHPQSSKTIKKIIYYERVIILLMVQHLVTEKYYLHQKHFHCVVQLLSQEFYAKIFHFLEDFIQVAESEIIQPKIQNQKSLIKKQAIKIIKDGVSIIKNDKQKLSNNQRYFEKFLELLQSKLNFIVRHSQIQDFLKNQIKNIQDLTSNLLYYNLLEYFAFFLLDQACYGWNIQFLQTCPSPYIHYESKKHYTLVLDMDQTLIHYKISNSSSGQFLLRPHLFQFLQNLAHYYEIGVFTCSLPEYADLILDHLRNIEFRLYRHHCIQFNGQFVKDLTRIGRDLKKTIIVDNLQRNFQLQKKNGIHIKSWYGDRKDKHLKKLQIELIKLAQSGVESVQQANFCRSFF